MCGSYSAPAFELGYEKANADNTKTVNTVLLGPTRCGDFLATFTQSPLWNGVVKLQVQKTDDTWADLKTYNNGDVRTASYTAWQITETFLDELLYYPYRVRVIVSTQATAGLCICYLMTDPPPANPLF